MQLAIPALLLALLQASLVRSQNSTVVVSNSNQLAGALLAPRTTEIVLQVPAKTPDSQIAVLTLAPEDFSRVGPVRIAAGDSIYVRSGDARVYLDFNNFIAPIVVDYNASLIFQNIGVQGAAQPGGFNEADTQAFIPLLLRGPTLPVYPGATIGFVNVTFLRTSTCLNFADRIEQSLTQAFGAASVSSEGPTLVSLTGQHEIALPPNVTSTQTGGAPVKLILQNITWACVPDPTVFLAPRAGPAASLVNVPVGYASSPGTTAVATSAGLAAALRDTSISTIYLGRSNGQGLDPSTVVLDKADFPEPINITSGRGVQLVSGSSANKSTLDFNNLASAILLQPRSALGFQDLYLANVASPQTIDPATYPYPAAQFLWSWPSVIGLDESMVSLVKSEVDVQGDCTNFAAVSSQQIALVYGQQYVSMPNNHTITLLGNHASRLPLQNVTTQEQVGNMTLISTDASAVCVDRAHLPVYPAPPAQSPSSSSGSSSRLGLILGLSLGLGVFATSLAALGVVFIALRRRRRAKENELAATPVAPVALTASGRGPLRKSDESADNTLSTAPHGTLWQLRYLGPLEDEQVEIGPLLGRGGFGRVYKGRWKGAVVAIKVVDHVAGSQGETTQQRMDRESLLSTSLAHPNIVTTFKISTVKSTGPGQSGQQSPEDTPMEMETKLGMDPGNGPREGGGSTSNSSEELLETWLVMEYCDRGSLLDAARAGRFIRKDDCTPDLLSMYRCLLDIATGMDYLHSAGIVHGDLKTANVLLKSTTSDSRGFVCKLGDFGLSRILTPGIYSHIVTRTYGTMAYMPPELLKTGHLARHTDVFSFGMLMWELFIGDEPFSGMAIGQIFFKTVIQNERPVIPDNCPPEYVDLMEICWATEASKRPNFAEIMKSLQLTWQRLRGELQTRKSSGVSSGVGPK